ncbi:Uma2 family endonuclease [Deinococcus planocerae]|uniref:Uma2 family endonuclease n=1 Tax=Deinococcus planocerae TaxID=1737569 RepID=UPI000C7F1487|nr:Uma2 family endonuclease [Deinococcus planocerae]
MSDPAPRAMSVEEYLRTEEKSPYKREYVGGFVYPLHGQAGASRPHALISGNVFGVLYLDAVRAGCRLYQNDMKLRTEGSTSFFYPDVMLVCDQDSGDNDAETSPCLLVEVLSQSTAAHDRFGKYGVYTAIPSLQTYLIVEQRERRVYAYSRQDGGWELQDLSGSGSIDIPCLGRRLTLDEIYLGVL